jgi:GTP cyclohydrolase I
MSAALELQAPHPHPDPHRPKTLPDLAHAERPVASGHIDRVGMEGIELPVFVRDRDGVRVRVPAVADAFVSLDVPDAKGIHMSRLFLSLQERLGREVLSPALVTDVLEHFVTSHLDISRSSALKLRFTHLRKASALSSEHSGWKSYPIEIAARCSDRGIRLEMASSVVYSSTCPCSAALSRQIAQQHFLQRFPAGAALDRDRVAAWIASPDGMPATPHSQRSHAHVRVAMSSALEGFAFDELIDAVEQAVATPVQSAVKREDEQAFAELNGRNLMFCEDAVRRIRAGLEVEGWIDDYAVRVVHEESLHPHDAVASLVKGVPGGFVD